MLNQLSLGFEFREAKEFCTHFTAMTAMFYELSPRALIKPVTVNVRDSQNVTAMMEASRICRVAVTSNEFIGRPSRKNLSRIIARLSRIKFQ